MSMQFLDFDVASSGAQVERAAAGDFIRYSIITVGTSGPRIRVKTDSGDDLVMKPGDKVRTGKRFTRLMVSSYDATAVTGFLQVGEGSFDSDSVVGNVTVDGTVVVSSVTATVTAKDEGITYGASFASTTALAANTAENVIAAASNLAGYVVWAANFLNNRSTQITNASLVAKATAPGTVIDGDVLLWPSSWMVTTNEFVSGGELKRAVRVALGKRLDFMSTSAEDNTPTGRRVLYTIL